MGGVESLLEEVKKPWWHVCVVLLPIPNFAPRPKTNFMVYERRKLQ